MRSEPKDIPIFSEPLQPGLYGNDSIMSLKNNPDVIVREGLTFSFNDLEKSTRYYAGQRDGITKLRNHGVRIPDFLIVFAKDQYNQRAAYYIVEKIHGGNLWELKKIPQEAASEIDQTISGYLQAILESFQADQPFFHDFRSFNLVWGHRSGEVDDHLYLVDVGAGEVASAKNNMFGNAVSAVDFFMMAVRKAKDASERCEELLGMKLLNTRKKIAEIESLYS